MQALSAAERRAAVARLLEAAQGPVSASALAAKFSVQRQIIVGDVALLRAAGADISATPRGYLVNRKRGMVERTVACVHAPEDMERELNAIVDAGGEAVDVVVEHPVYGQLTGALHVRSPVRRGAVYPPGGRKQSQAPVQFDRRGSSAYDPHAGRGGLPQSDPGPRAGGLSVPYAVKGALRNKVLSFSPEYIILEQVSTECVSVPERKMGGRNESEEKE